MREYGSLIGNEEVFSDNWLDVTNPYTGECVGRVNQLPVAKTIEQYSDIFGFTLFNMGYDKLPNPPKAKIKS